MFKKVLAIKFFSAGTDAIAVIQHPDSMFLVRVSTKGVSTRVMRLRHWVTEMVSENGIIIDRTDNLYMATHADPATEFAVLKLNPFVHYLSTLTWASTYENGGAYAITMSTDERYVYIGGVVEDSAYLVGLWS